MDIHGKVALVTGGTRGIGRAITEHLLNNGAKVVMVATNREVGEAVAEQLQHQYGQDTVVFVRADVAVHAQLEVVYKETVKQYGGIDIVVNNAGVGYMNPRIIEINIGGVIHSTTLAVEHMTSENGGRGGVIVNMSSIAGLPDAASGQPLYSCTKHAVIGYSTALARRLEKSSGVRVVLLCPGFVKTDLTRIMQEREADGNEVARQTLALYAGWTDVTRVANVCIDMIQSEAVTSGTIVKVTPAGAKVLDLRNILEFDLNDVISTGKKA